LPCNKKALSGGRKLSDGGGLSRGRIGRAGEVRDNKRRIARYGDRWEWRNLRRHAKLGSEKPNYKGSYDWTITKDKKSGKEVLLAKPNPWPKNVSSKGVADGTGPDKKPDQE